MKCEKCKVLMELFDNTSQTKRDYWLMTELFVMLHDGDECPEAGRVSSVVKAGSTGCEDEGRGGIKNAKRFIIECIELLPANTKKR